MNFPKLTAQQVFVRNIQPQACAFKWRQQQKRFRQRLKVDPRQAESAGKTARKPKYISRAQAQGRDGHNRLEACFAGSPGTYQRFA
jgi:hypothetical protein